LKKLIHAAALSSLAIAPSALAFGYFTWSITELWYFMLVLHCLGFIAAVALFLQPTEIQWKFLKAFASSVGQNDPKSNEMLSKLEEFELQDQTEQSGPKEVKDLWGARRRK
jgi:hypothetical protein